MERIRGIADKIIRLLTVGTTVALGTGGCEPKKTEPVVTVDPMDQPREEFHMAALPLNGGMSPEAYKEATGIGFVDMYPGGGSPLLLEMPAENGSEMFFGAVTDPSSGWSGVLACDNNGDCSFFESSAENRIDPGDKPSELVFDEVAIDNNLQIVDSPHKEDKLTVTVTGDDRGGVEVKSVKVTQTADDGSTPTPEVKATPTTQAEKEDANSWFYRLLMSLKLIKPTPAPTATISGPEPTATTIARPTEEPTPEPTPVLINEKDLEPFYVNPANVEFMGVRINSELIVDDSISTSIEKVTVPDNVFAEFIARTLFKVWWSKGEVKHTTASTEADFKAFMALVAKAQTGNDPADWRAVQINNIWANDLNDGNGYVQEPYSIWPMFSGQAPEGVRGISKIANVLVRAVAMKNITLWADNVHGSGMGVNIDNESGTLYIYNLVGSSYYDHKSISSSLSASAWWLKINAGGGYSGYGVEDAVLRDFLWKGGLRVY